MRGALAVTGVPLTTLAGAGAAAIAGGGALHHWSARAGRAVPAQADLCRGARSPGATRRLTSFVHDHWGSHCLALLNKTLGSSGPEYRPFDPDAAGEATGTMAAVE